MKKNTLLILLFVIYPVLLFGQHLEDGQPGFLIKPYLQFSTMDEMSILWETNLPSSSRVLFGESRFNTGKAILDQSVENDALKTMHELTLQSLEPETNYFYKVVSITEAGDTIQTDVLPFKTAVDENSPFAFTVFSDSQSNPDVWGKVTSQAIKERPNFAIHAGDQVGLGYRKQEWIYDFFEPAHNFMKQTPMFTILGNHEHDAAYYYQYFKNPEPEHYYSFRYGNAEFFIMDTNQYQEPGTPMYYWLEHALASSDAEWKFVIQHHPPYSSEENDFGDTNYERSKLGDSEAKLLIPLFEKYGVDIVFYGHLHMYERTWPILNDKAVEEGGVTYINVGGAGGHLEEAAPTRNWFTNKLRTIHHFVYVAINGETLQYQAIDEDGNLFDHFVLTSSRENIAVKEMPPVTPVPKQNQRVFNETIRVDLETVNPRDEIHFTTDGSEPDRTSKKVYGSVILDESTELKAVAYSQHGKSGVSEFEFTEMKPLKSIGNTKDFKKGVFYRYYIGELEDEKHLINEHLEFESSGSVSVLSTDQITHREKNWGAVFSGYLEVPETGYYKFNGHAYHVFRFYLHDELMIEEYNREIDGSAEVYLEKGLHPFRVEYHTHRTYNYMRFEYTGPDGIRKPINTLNFYH